jgi:hypothetical protein
MVALSFSTAFSAAPPFTHKAYQEQSQNAHRPPPEIQPGGFAEQVAQCGNENGFAIGHYFT